MKEIKLVIFDMDGLLIDSERHMWSHNAEKLFTRLGYKYDLEWHRTQMGVSHEKFEENAINCFGKDFPVSIYFQELLKMNEETIKNKEVPLMKGTIELLEYLKENNIQVTIATSTKKEMAHRLMEATGIDKYFATITTGDEVENGKPSPDIYLKALSKFNVPKENAIVLEDAHNGFIAAYNAGIDCIIVEDLAIIEDDDRKIAYKVTHNLNEVLTLLKENNIK